MARAKKEYPPLPEGLNLGDMVEYYDQGWRYGTLENVINGQAQIRNVAVYGKTEGTLSKVPIGDIKIITK
jgi:hypothetical protein